MLEWRAVVLSPDSRAALLNIARFALREKLSPPTPVPAPAESAKLPEITSPELLAPAGCFVSLHEHSTHRLRGCVGRIEATKPVWETVYRTAGETLADPRFVNERLTLADLANLNIEISVLSPPRAAATPLDFELLEDGIYLTIANRAGFFLPQVARETLWTKEQLLARLCSEKLGLHPQVWQRPGARLFTFKVEVIGPEPVQSPAGGNAEC